MLWLQTPPWRRWLIAVVLATVAVWVEFRPDPTVEHPFAVVEINPGDQVDNSNTEMRRVPGGLLDPIQGGISTSTIAAGEPILTSDVAESESHIPTGWWIVAANVPADSTPGDRVRVVLLASGDIVDGVVTAATTDDPFSAASGAIAVEPRRAGEVAMAANDGQIAVLVSTGN